MEGSAVSQVDPAASATMLSSAGEKRKRSPSPSADQHASAAPPPSKTPKTDNHLQINYLARQFNDDLPLLAQDDTNPNILALINEYQGVLNRNESMACNLGARPLGPILIKKFERLFDSPPKIVKSHGKDGTTVTWLDVVEFARSKPEQFSLSQMSEGVRVCQFYTKQCRVQISEDDFVLINSGIPRKMIPPQPIIEDEEKELGTLEILESNLIKITHQADKVAAHARQLNHKLKHRKQAILERRATEPAVSGREGSPSNVALMNGINGTQQGQPGLHPVNGPVNGEVVGGSSRQTGVSKETIADLKGKFFTLKDRTWQEPGFHYHQSGQLRRPAALAPPDGPRAARPSASRESVSMRSVYPDPTEDPHSSSSPYQTNAAYPAPHPGAVPIPQTPTSLLPLHGAGQGSRGTSTGAHGERDDGGPFKAQMVAHMESLAKGERIMPPCDRCRRLHMDCVKNLTACLGCTKKHAKCSWKEVREGELHRGAPDASVGYYARPESEQHYDPNLYAHHPDDRAMGMNAERDEEVLRAALTQANQRHPLEEQAVNLRELAGAAVDSQTALAIELAERRLQRAHTPPGQASVGQTPFASHYQAPEARMMSAEAREQAEYNFPWNRGRDQQEPETHPHYAQSSHQQYPVQAAQQANALNESHTGPHTPEEVHHQEQGQEQIEPQSKYPELPDQEHDRREDGGGEH